MEYEVIDFDPTLQINYSECASLWTKECTVSPDDAI